ncbi:hypothetical protein BDW69DRAFT_155106 [Aspergillus filifer]
MGSLILLGPSRMRHPGGITRVGKATGAMFGCRTVKHGATKTVLIGVCCCRRRDLPGYTNHSFANARQPLVNSYLGSKGLHREWLELSERRFTRVLEESYDHLLGEDDWGVLKDSLRYADCISGRKQCRDSNFVQDGKVRGRQARIPTEKSERRTTNAGSPLQFHRSVQGRSSISKCASLELHVRPAICKPIQSTCRRRT